MDFSFLLLFVCFLIRDRFLNYQTLYFLGHFMQRITLTCFPELRWKEASIFLVFFCFQAHTIIERKTHLSSREMTDDNEYKNKNRKEDWEICWETPLEATAGVSELRTSILDLPLFKSDTIGLAVQLPLLPSPRSFLF